MDARNLALATRCKGFLDEEEGLRLYELAKNYSGRGPLVEIGSYCGKSSIYLGTGAKEAGGTLVCIDHHRGSEEMQAGEEYHDPDVFDSEAGLVDTLGFLRNTIREAQLEDTAVLMVTSSRQAAALVGDGVGLVFIDGGHSEEAAHTDYEVWSPKIASGGVLAVHDLFPDPADGGQAPIEVYRRALASGHFEELPTTKTLGVLLKR